MVLVLVVEVVGWMVVDTVVMVSFWARFGGRGS